jgi:hypothetical protein
MDPLQEHSSVDSTADGESFQPHNIDPSKDIPTAFEELCDHQTTPLYGPPTQTLALTCEEERFFPVTPIFGTNIQVAARSLDITTTAETPEIPCEIIPIPPIVVPFVDYHQIEQVSESGELKLMYIV